MRRRPLIPTVALLTALSFGGAAFGQSGETVSPYFQVIVDTSGSMGDCGACATVANSCGQPSTRMNAAKCVLSDLINAYAGDVLFGLSEFTMGCFTVSGGRDVYAAACGSDPSIPVSGADAGRTLVPIGEDNDSALLSFLDFSPDFADDLAILCPGSDEPGEIETNEGEPGAMGLGYGLTPLAGSLRSAQRYYQGNDPDFPGSPIASDPFFGCRPYYVILLTDGFETCSTHAQAVAAAGELRSTNVPGVGTVDIRTFVIGFGVPDPSTEIEEIATAGGTDAFYASNETQLALAFAEIVQDSLLIEVCDNDDNDCDGEIDEGFVKYCDLESGITGLDLCMNPGDPCDDQDDNCFAGTADEVKNACGVCGPTPTEVCNGVDDDCDGFIDEDDVCAGCTVEPEICDGRDNDCDGRIDEGISRPCGSDVGLCTPGTQICIEQMTEQPSGTWGMCDGTGPSPEACDGEDNDCDGVVDGFSQECYTFGTGCTIGVGCMGVCRTGEQLCDDGSFGACVGEVGPGTEICNDLDDDCDGMVDEGDPGGGVPCSSGCGAGETECVMGEIVCTGGSAAEDEECNGFDDDCDGITDEDVDPMGPCDEDGTLCEPGTLECVGGAFMCVGGVPPAAEQCDCEDNDCDDTVDEGDLCSAGASCLGGPWCVCARPCEDSEFPCPLGQICVDTTGDGDRFCVPDPCAGIVCDPLPNGDPTQCVEGECVGLCEGVTCGDPLVCRPEDGVCVRDDCIGFPDRCEDDELCVAGECVTDACEGVECEPNQFCRDGGCVDSCAGVDCPAGQSCSGGVCVDDPCDGVSCQSFEVCDPATGECTQDLCPNPDCLQGEVCDPVSGECVPDPCFAIECPMGQLCVDGNCFHPGDLEMLDAGVPQFVSAGGGASCGCRATGDPPGGGWWLLIGVVALGLRRRRSR